MLTTATILPDTLVTKNRDFYDGFWARTYLTRPERFNTWALVSGLLPGSRRRLEVGPGLRPRLPVEDTHFIDLSAKVTERLRAWRGLARVGEITELPYVDGYFDLVAAFDVVEHARDDEQVFAELTRTLKPGGQLVFSVPLYAAHWTSFDDYVGHARRYEPAALKAMLARHGLVVEKSAVFGMQTNNPRLLHHAVQGLIEHPLIAAFCYNWLFFPLGLLLQKPLKFADGLMDLTGVHEVLVVCRRE